MLSIAVDLNIGTLKLIIVNTLKFMGIDLTVSEIVSKNTKSVDPDQTAPKEQSDHCLYCLLRTLQSQYFTSLPY